jgi:hypothetical protein
VERWLLAEIEYWSDLIALFAVFPSLFLLLICNCLKYAIKFFLDKIFYFTSLNLNTILHH